MDARLAGPLDGVCDVLEALGTPVILIDHDRYVVRTNSIAASKLGTDLKIANRRLIAAEHKAGAALDELLHAVTAAAHPLTQYAVAIPRSEARPFVVYAVRLVGTALGTFAPACALVLLLDPHDAPLPAEGLLTAGFGLTASEAKLAIRLAAGDCLETAAETCGISYEAARNRLKTIFQKTLTHRQTELVVLLSRLALIPKCFDISSGVDVGSNKWTCPKGEILCGGPSCPMCFPSTSGTALLGR